MKTLKQYLCQIFGHKFHYYGGLIHLPRYCECKRCGKKWKADYRGDLINEPEKIWHEI